MQAGYCSQGIAHQLQAYATGQILRDNEVIVTILNLWAWFVTFESLYLYLLKVLRFPIVIPEELATCPAPAIWDPKWGWRPCSLWSQWLWLLLCLVIQSFGEWGVPWLSCCGSLFDLFLYLHSSTLRTSRQTNSHHGFTHNRSWWLWSFETWS